MSAFLSHIDLMPLVYGIIMFLGIWSMWYKLMQFKLWSFAVEAGVFWIVFSMHGGSMSGGFAAMIAALIAGQVLTRRKS